MPIEMFAAVLRADQHRLVEERGTWVGEAWACNGGGLCVVVVVALPSKKLKIEATDLKAEDATLEGEYLRQIVDIVIRRIPSILQIRPVRVLVCLCRPLWQ